jgi:hypothetical protein
MRAILDSDPRRLVILLAALSGFGNAVDRASGRSLGDGNSLPVWAIVALCFVLGGIGGVLSVYAGGFVLRQTGRLLGGRATAVEVRSALAWSSVPLIWSLLLWPPELALLGREMFTTATPTLDANPLLIVPLGLLILVEVVVGLWAFVVFLKALGEAHGFSAWRSLGATLLGVLAIVVPALIVVVPVVVVAAAASPAGG